MGTEGEALGGLCRWATPSLFPEGFFFSSLVFFDTQVRHWIGVWMVGNRLPLSLFLFFSFSAICRTTLDIYPSGFGCFLLFCSGLRQRWSVFWRGIEGDVDGVDRIV